MKDKVDIKPIIEELKKYEQEGVKFYSDGQERSMREIVKAFYVSEKTEFMRDYVFNEENGQLKEIRFDEIRKPRKRRRNKKK